MLKKGNQFSFVRVRIKATHLAYFLFNREKSFNLTYWFNHFLCFVFGLAFIFPPAPLGCLTLGGLSV